MKKHLLAAVALAALSAGSANAAVISYSFSNPEQTTEIHQNGTLGLFDSTLGTLTGVTLTLNGSETTNFTLTNFAAQQQSVNASGIVDLFFTSSLAGLNLSGSTLHLSASTGLVNVQPTNSESFGPLTAADSLVLAPLASLFSVAGGGQFSLSCESLSGVSLIGGGGNITAAQSTTAGCGAQIVYDYQPGNHVPEPTSMALIGLGALGLASVRRRK